MEKLFDTGKRFERLLYVSVLFILASFLFYNISSAVVKEKSQEKFDSLDYFLNYLNMHAKDFEIASLMSKEYRGYKDASAGVRSEREAKIKERRRNAIADNKGRVKLGLNENDIDSFDERKDFESESGILNQDKIKNVRAALGLEPMNEISGAENVYDEAYSHIVISTFIHDKDLMDAFLNMRQKNMQDIIGKAKEMIEDLNKRNVQIFNIETPIQFPFSVGDMKSKVSLYNIHSAGAYVLPIIMIIWLGSIGMTRSKELYLLVKTACIIDIYPHVFNVFFSFDRKITTVKETKKMYQLALFGDPNGIKGLRSSANFTCYIRVFLSVAFLGLITIPFYWGVFISMQSLSFINCVFLIFAFLVNFFQCLCFVANELSLRNAVFIIDGDNYEILN